MDLVVTLRTDNTLLYDRYVARGYSEEKIEQNIDSEIYNLIGEENKEFYLDEGISPTLVELQSDTNEDMQSNLQRIVDWIEQWRKDNVPTNGD